ncbi:MAG: hypothetical protein AB4050_01780 [Synechococcus sp.]
MSPAERAQDAIKLARKALNEMSWAASEGDLVEALGHESEVSCQLSRLEGIICRLTYKQQ